ncbi:MAG TPA: methyltransferase domain-containing protein [bacterium]|nr:methyltransferase domain-containing protein [bacterium]
MSTYHQNIIAFYDVLENPLRMIWDLDKSYAIHYGYWDEKVKSFPESLLRMNEVMAETAQIKSHERVLDAGCGVGGSSIFLARTIGCKTVGITLSANQVQRAKKNAQNSGTAHLNEFKVMDYSHTDFEDASFDVVWGCESICYADNKEEFVKEVYRILKPGGRFIMADGMVQKFEDNDNPIVAKGRDGWAANYVETPERFKQFLENTGFTNITYRDITDHIMHSAKRLYWVSFPAKLNQWIRPLFGKTVAEHNKGNVNACKYQYLAFKKRLLVYGILCGVKR